MLSGKTVSIMKHNILIVEDNLLFTHLLLA